MNNKAIAETAIWQNESALRQIYDNIDKVDIIYYDKGIYMVAVYCSDDKTDLFPKQLRAKIRDETFWVPIYLLNNYKKIKT